MGFLGGSRIGMAVHSLGPSKQGVRVRPSSRVAAPAGADDHEQGCRLARIPGIAGSGYNFQAGPPNSAEVNAGMVNRERGGLPKRSAMSSKEVEATGSMPTD